MDASGASINSVDSRSAAARLAVVSSSRARFVPPLAAPPAISTEEDIAAKIRKTFQDYEIKRANYSLALRAPTVTRAPTTAGKPVSYNVELECTETVGANTTKKKESFIATKTDTRFEITVSRQAGEPSDAVLSAAILLAAKESSGNTISLPDLRDKSLFLRCHKLCQELKVILQPNSQQAAWLSPAATSAGTAATAFGGAGAAGAPSADAGVEAAVVY